jgi:hypothetical protein
LYDIIGDIHGHADELVALLELLGYRCHGGHWTHATRTAVFVGDFIDRGPQIREVLNLVRPMCDSGNALAVMGNHEFNALAYHTPNPTKPAEFLRPNSEKNTRQHTATLEQVPSHELKEHLEWFRRLPMWLELDGLRIVHACWDPQQISVIETAKQKYAGVSTDFLCEATNRGTSLYKAIEDVLKGKEMTLPDGVRYFDKDGHKRSAMRIKWYRAPHDDTIASFALTADDGLPTAPLGPSSVGAVTPYPTDAVPVFFGHYWLRAQIPKPLAMNVACLDYSVASGGSLCAYRWDGEKEIDDDKFVTVDARQRKR